MPHSLLDILKDVHARDDEEKILKVHKDPTTNYSHIIRTMHNLVHANVIHLGMSDETNTHHAVFALKEACLAMIRVIGYRLGWSQQLLLPTVFYVSAFDSVDSVELAQGRAEMLQAMTE